MKNTKIQTNKVIKVKEFQGEFGDMQRRFRYQEGLEWRRRSLGFNKYAIKKRRTMKEKPVPLTDILY